MPDLVNPDVVAMFCMMAARLGPFSDKDGGPMDDGERDLTRGATVAELETAAARLQAAASDLAAAAAAARARAALE